MSDESSRKSKKRNWESLYPSQSDTLASTPKQPEAVYDEDSLESREFPIFPQVPSLAEFIDEQLRNSTIELSKAKIDNLRAVFEKHLTEDVKTMQRDYFDRERDLATMVLRNRLTALRDMAKRVDADVFQRVLVQHGLSGILTLFSTKEVPGDKRNCTCVFRNSVTLEQRAKRQQRTILRPRSDIVVDFKCNRDEIPYRRANYIMFINKPDEGNSNDMEPSPIPSVPEIYAMFAEHLNNPLNDCQAVVKCEYCIEAEKETEKQKEMEKEKEMKMRKEQERAIIAAQTFAESKNSPRRRIYRNPKTAQRNILGKVTRNVLGNDPGIISNATRKVGNTGNRPADLPKPVDPKNATANAAKTESPREKEKTQKVVEAPGNMFEQISRRIRGNTSDNAPKSVFSTIPRAVFGSIPNLLGNTLKTVFGNARRVLDSLPMSMLGNVLGHASSGLTGLEHIPRNTLGHFPLSNVLDNIPRTVQVSAARELLATIRRPVRGNSRRNGLTPMGGRFTRFFSGHFEDDDDDIPRNTSERCARVITITPRIVLRQPEAVDSITDVEAYLQSRRNSERRRRNGRNFRDVPDRLVGSGDVGASLRNRIANRATPGHLPNGINASANAGDLPNAIRRSANVPVRLPNGINRPSNIPGPLPNGINRSANVSGHVPNGVVNTANSAPNGIIHTSSNPHHRPNGIISANATGHLPNGTVNGVRNGVRNGHVSSGNSRIARVIPEETVEEPRETGFPRVTMPRVSPSLRSMIPATPTMPVSPAMEAYRRTVFAMSISAGMTPEAREAVLRNYAVQSPVMRTLGSNNSDFTETTEDFETNVPSTSGQTNMRSTSQAKLNKQRRAAKKIPANIRQAALLSANYGKVLNVAALTESVPVIARLEFGKNKVSRQEARKRAIEFAKKSLNW